MSYTFPARTSASRAVRGRGRGGAAVGGPAGRGASRGRGTGMETAGAEGPAVGAPGQPQSPEEQTAQR